MYDITATPHIIGAYWRPWKEDSDLLDNYLDFVRDKSMIRYGANLVGDSIQNASNSITSATFAAAQMQASAIEAASNRQIHAIAQASAAQIQAINYAANAIGIKIEAVGQEISFLSRKMDVLIEQQRMSNFLLQNVIELLKIPDSEKERQHSITVGLKFYVNSSKDPDLLDDALEEFKHAESLMKQDYFVLNRIGMIYLYSEKHLNPEMAKDYFLRAAKYASVESDPDAVRLVSYLTPDDNGNAGGMQISDIGLLAADSYEKAAFASYVLGNDQDAVMYQRKAYSLNCKPESNLLSAKYLVRAGDEKGSLDVIKKVIDEKPSLVKAAFADYDLMLCPQIINYSLHYHIDIKNKIEHALTSPYYRDCAPILLSALCQNDTSILAELVSLYSL